MRTDTIFYKGTLKTLKKKTVDSEGAVSKEKSLSNLVAQRLLALQNNDTKTANLIDKIIQLLQKKK